MAPTTQEPFWQAEPVLQLLSVQGLLGIWTVVQLAPLDDVSNVHVRVPLFVEQVLAATLEHAVQFPDDMSHNGGVGEPVVPPVPPVPFPPPPEPEPPPLAVT